MTYHQSLSGRMRKASAFLPTLDLESGEQKQSLYLQSACLDTGRKLHKIRTNCQFKKCSKTRKTRELIRLLCPVYSSGDQGTFICQIVQISPMNRKLIQNPSIRKFGTSQGTLSFNISPPLSNPLEKYLWDIHKDELPPFLFIHGQSTESFVPRQAEKYNQASSLWLS